MKTSVSNSYWIMASLSLLTCFFVTQTCLAAKGGNGGGKPGGSDPPSYPVQYSITRVNTPFPSDQYTFSDHSNDAAVVGWGFLDETDGRRAMAYLPSIAAEDAFMVEDLVLAGDIEPGWHSRSATGINNQGAIVGNLESFGGGDARLPFLIPDAYASQPRLEILGPFDPLANETALRINDSGDLVIWSHTPSSNRLFLGNTADPASSFVEIDFRSAGLSNPSVETDQAVRMTKRHGAAPAWLTGSVQDGEDRYLFRVSMDGSNLELLQTGTPFLTDDNGTYSVRSSGNDVNANGDMMVQAEFVQPSRKGKSKTTSTLYAASWLNDTNQVVPVIGDDPLQVGGSLAWTNNDGDFLIGIFYPDLWHGDWSPDNGALTIANLIDPNDPNSELFNGGQYVTEMTDRDATGWPTLIKKGNLLILDPVLNTAALGSAAAVPEPTAALLTLVALFSLICVRPAAAREC